MKGVKQMVKSFFIKIIEFMCSIVWKLQFLWCKTKICFGLKNKYKTLIDLKNSANVFLIPHADDELIGNYQFITRLKGEALLLYFGMTGSCNSIDNKKVRENELARFCKEKGIKYKTISSHDDLFDFLPKNVHINLFFPSCIDWHNEHRLISEYVLKYISPSKNISFFWYSISVPIMLKKVIYIEESKKDIKQKYADFKYNYISQKHLPIKRFMFQERLNGMRINRFAAENYLEVSFDELALALSFCKNNEVRLNELKKNINNINKIRKESQKIYSELFEGGYNCETLRKNS